jgi:hypothetical protein
MDLSFVFNGIARFLIVMISIRNCLETNSSFVFNGIGGFLVVTISIRNWRMGLGFWRVIGGEVEGCIRSFPSQISSGWGRRKQNRAEKYGEDGSGFLEGLESLSEKSRVKSQRRTPSATPGGR